MLHHELNEEQGILMVTPEAPLAKSDFEELARVVDPYIEKQGSLAALVIEAQSFPGWENFAGLVSHLRFVRDHHRKIQCVAVISDSKLLSVAPHVASHFVAAEIKQFPAAERQAALNWARGREKSDS
jgi:hypothetical protein